MKTSDALKLALQGVKKYVDNSINTNSIVRPYEIFRVEETIFGKTGYIDVETMEPSVKYGLAEEYLDCSSFAFVIPTATTPYSVVCLAASFQVSDLMVTEKWEGDPSKGEEGLYIIARGLNEDYKINIRHKESKDGVTVEVIRNTRYLHISNTKEFIPTGDYNPATKKYVDDAIDDNKFSGDYNDLENRPCYEDEGDIPEYLNIEIYPDTDFSDKESVEVVNGTSDNGNCINYRKYVKLFSDITIDMINTMKEYGVLISDYEGQLIEDPLINLLDEGRADQGMYSIGIDFEFILQAPEGYYLPENGLWYMESWVDRDLNGNLIAEYKTVDDVFNGILLIKDNGELNAGTIKQLDEKFIPDTIATKKYVDDNKDFIHLTGTTENPIVLTALELGRYLIDGPVKFHPGLNAANVQNKDNYQVTIGMKTASAIRGTVMVNGLLSRFHYNYSTQEWFKSDFVTRSEVLSLTNYEEYTPTENYHPATKKYVDGAVSGLSDNLQGQIDELFQNVSNGKELIASAITDKGVDASEEETFQSLSEKIGLIPSGPPGSNIIGYINEENDIYVSLTELESGTYTLKFEDYSGLLDDFDDIGNVEVE